MANGIINFNTNNAKLEGRIVWSSKSNGATENSSNVYAELQARRPDGYTTMGTFSGILNIAGEEQGFSNHTSLNTDWQTFKSFSKKVSHRDDGFGESWISGYINGPSGTSLAGVTASGGQTVQLDRIARKSSVTCADGNIGSSTTININRQNVNFTHTLKYNFGTLSGTIITKTSNTNVGWNIPTSFYAQIPNNTSGTGTITCETYNDDELIGSDTCNFTAFVVNSNPVISGTVVDVNNNTIGKTEDPNKIVRYMSNVNVIINATAKNNATIKSYKIVCEDGKSATTQTATLNSVESGNFEISTTDSRGLSSSTTISKTMINYIKLAFTEVTLKRPGTTSNTINATIKGNYFNGSFGKVANTIAFKWRYRVAGGSWGNYTSVTPTISNNTFTYKAILGTSFDYKQSYEFEFVVNDKLMTDIKNKPVTKGIPIIDIGENDVIINGNFKILENQDVTAYRGATPNGDLKDVNLKTGLYGAYAENKNLPDGNIVAQYGNLMNIQQDAWRFQLYHATYLLKSMLATREYINGAWTNWQYVQMYPTTLYENSSGTNGTVTLSESITKFSYIEIFYKSDTGSANKSVRVPAINNLKVALLIGSAFKGGGNDKEFRFSRRILIDKQMTIITESVGYTHIKNNNVEQNNANNLVYIYKVLGYL